MTFRKVVTIGLLVPLSHRLGSDAPPQLVHDLVCDLRLEVEDVLGYGWCESFADDKENALRAGVGGGREAGRGPTHNKLPSNRRLEQKVYGRRWKLEEAERDAVLSSSESEDEAGLDGIAKEKETWREKLPHILLEIFTKCSGGGVVAEGHKLEEAMLQVRGRVRGGVKSVRNDREVNTKSPVRTLSLG